MILRHFTTIEKLKLIQESGYLVSKKTEGKEIGRIYFEEYKDNDYLLDFMLQDEKYKNLDKEDFVSLEFDSDVLIQHGINFIKSIDYTNSETLIFIGRLYTQEEQENIGDYYIVINQDIPMSLCRNKKHLENIEY